MKKRYNLGIFLEGGGIRTFYGGGVIDGLKKIGVRIDYYSAISASAGTIFGNMFNCSNEVMKIFGKKCDHNKKNFYWTRKQHFPHNEMMESALVEIFERHIKGSGNGNWEITAGKTTKDYSRIKIRLITLLMIMKNFFGINLFAVFRKMFDVLEEKISSKDKASRKDIISLIMGSSSIYPFIKPHYLKGDLLLEANCLDLDYEKCLVECKKGIIIYNRVGKSYIKGNILHLYSSQNLEWNILDYTSKEKLEKLRRQGLEEVRRQERMIKMFSH